MIGLKTYESLIGRKIKLPELGEFTLVGVVDQESPSIYAKKKMLKDIVYSNPGQSAADAYDMDEFESYGEKEITKYRFVENEEGFKFGYVGQALKLLDRCAQHLEEYDHIALSLN